MIPVGDANRQGGFPVVVYALVLLNLYVFSRELSTGTREGFINAYALIPYDFTHGVQLAAPAPPTLATLVTAQFLHGGLLHIGFNMLFLAVFGPGIEAVTGHLRFASFYLACGVCGNLAQVWATPNSHVPSIGASGAIAGVLGAYLVRFPLRGVETIVPVGCLPLFVRLPAVLVIGLWAAVQFVHGYGAITTRVLSERGGGVAYFAHIGGFVAGALGLGLVAPRSLGRRRRPRYGP